MNHPLRQSHLVAPLGNRFPCRRAADGIDGADGGAEACGGRVGRDSSKVDGISSARSAGVALPGDGGDWALKNRLIMEKSIIKTGGPMVAAKGQRGRMEGGETAQNPHNSSSLPSLPPAL